MDKCKKILPAILGVCIGDALGVPVEFMSRKELLLKPVTTMIGNGTHDQDKGTWSDDTSLTLCLIESLCNGYNLKNIAKSLCDWLYEKKWTANGYVFDIGGTTSESLEKLKYGATYGCSGVNTAGNGALMRILPLAFYLDKFEENKYSKISEVACLTHNNVISSICCSIYIDFAISLINNKTKNEAYIDMQKSIKEKYSKTIYENELEILKRLLTEDISNYSIKEIRSTGYVVDTLEASLWCILTTSNFKDAVLKAINLGDDTDTVGAVTGGLAGIIYGIDEMPKEWIITLKRKNDIINLLERFKESLY